MNTKRAKKLWPRIYTIQREGRQVFQVDLRAVNGGRPIFDTKIEAESYAEQARIAKGNEGTLFFALPQDAKIDAVKAHQKLAPHGITILEAAKYYEKHVLAYKTAPLVKEIVALYILDSKKRNLKPRSMEDLTNRLNMFALDFGDSKLYEITIDELKDWVFDDEWEPLTTISYLTKISQLYNYAKHVKKWVDSNITEDITRPKKDATEIRILTVDQAKAMLNHANTFGLLPYVALGLFCGIRSAELLRMTARNISFENKTVTVPSNAAKTRLSRGVTMQPALLAWLDPHKQELEKGASIVENFRKNFEDLRQAAGITDWPPNGLRHSYASYYLAKFQNANETAEQMGNSTEIVKRHYKAVVYPSEAEKYWNLLP